MRHNEFKIRLKEAQSAYKAPPELRKAAVKLANKAGSSKKAVCVIFGCTYQQLKEWGREFPEIKREK